ncbi:hypothetical protein Moror_10831 [Moniliophthora roreri MCA 2997]|uniref:Terpene synthase n=2 Tax=Moniliophthora roreri TaxID=221103 RepID=V2X5D0_MONRO|nr:hypothetical protein Moror_10831 [Moniliophthora roreri MCA 2997]KAI3621232.1 hypothetical protein WG66_014359 [Moniliophthora roreri]
MGRATVLTFTLPDLEMFSALPDGGINPHHEMARQESRRWVAQYTNVTFGPKMKAFYEKCEFELSSSYCYPQLDREGLRAVMDLVNILWFADEVTDAETGSGASRTAETVCRTLRDPEYNDGTPLCLTGTFCSFRINHLSKAGPETSRRFMEHCHETFFAFSEEAELRAQGEVLSIAGYLSLRKRNGRGGVRPCFDLAECFLDMDLPDCVHRLEIFRRGHDAAVDLVGLANDLYSYNVQQARGYGTSNIVTVVMKARKIGLQEASDYVGCLCKTLLSNLQESQRAIEDLARDAKDEDSANTFRDALRALEAYSHWVRGNAIDVAGSARLKAPGLGLA